MQNVGHFASVSVCQHVAFAINSNPGHTHLFVNSEASACEVHSHVPRVKIIQPTSKVTSFAEWLWDARNLITVVISNDGICLLTETE